MFVCKVTERFSECRKQKKKKKIKMIKSSNVDIFVFVILVIPRHVFTGYMANKKLKALTPVNMFTQPVIYNTCKSTNPDPTQTPGGRENDITRLRLKYKMSLRMR